MHVYVYVYGQGSGVKRKGMGMFRGTMHGQVNGQGSDALARREGSSWQRASVSVPVHLPFPLHVNVPVPMPAWPDPCPYTYTCPCPPIGRYAPNRTRLNAIPLSFKGSRALAAPPVRVRDRR